MTSVRVVLTDAAWAEMASILEEIKPKAGRPPEQSDRMVIEAVLSMARKGIPWRDLPKDFGHWDAVYNRFRRWEARGLWKKLWERLQADDAKRAKHLWIDRTMIRAPQHAAGAFKKPAATPHRLWDVLGEAFPPRSTPDVAMNTPASPSC
jgi:transposase